MAVQVFINGKSFQVDPLRIPVDTSLNTFIRQEANLSGTKSMCHEGGCGACIVAIQGLHPVSKETRIWAVNSCLMPVYACEGLNVITIEGIGDRATGYHVAQSRLAQLNGTQCGYCSPGMVMNMYSLMESKQGHVTMEDVENSFGGNVCRCTGYRPILDAFKSLAVDADDKFKLCTDIEDFGAKKCPTTGVACSGSCTDKATNGVPKSTHLNVSEREWHKVYDMSEIFQILGQNPDKSYMLVAGNTAHGVYRRSKDIKIFIDVNSVDQLRSHSIGKQLEIGGGVKLTEFMQILQKAAVTDAPNYTYCKEMHSHVDLIANVPVRNAGSLAGNLMIKHKNPDFPSDIYVLLGAVDATLSIAEADGKIAQVSIVDFLKTSMHRKIIMKVNLPPLDSDQYKLKSFKIMKRAQNTHAYVNAAFLFEFAKQSTVSSCILCFGGINEHFTRAEDTQKLLVGRKLFSNETLHLVSSSLEKELRDMPWNMPDADPEYRKQLAIGLFYKAVLQLAPQDHVAASLRSGGDLLSRPISSGIQEFDTYEEDWPVTKAIPKFEGYIQTAGEAKYANDLPRIPGETWAVFLQATEVGSKVKRIDATLALKQPGVHGFFSAKDIPGANNFTPLCFKMLNQECEEIFCSETVLYYGQPLGVLVADSVILASQAVKLVQVQYEKTGAKILPTIWDVFESNAQDRISKQPFSRVAEKSGGNTTKIIKGRYECGGQYHYTMEPQSVVVIPSEYGLEVHSSTQYMDSVQIAISESLLIPQHEIHVVVKRLGGGYGGKITRPSILACAAALAAHKLQRPVRLILSMEANMEVIGKRFPCIGDYEVEVDNNGKIQKLNNEFWQDFGCSLNETVVPLTAQWFLNCYTTDFWSWNSWAVLTDSASNTYCRAPGILEGVSMIENIMEHISFETGLCPIQVRLNNMPDDQILRGMISDFLIDSDYTARKSAIETFNSENRWKKKGIALVPLDYPQQFFGNFPAMVSVYHGDGTVLISHAGIEMGQGLNTKVAQVAAKTLNIRIEYIRFRPCDSMTGANAMCSGGSSTSDAIAVAVMHACEMILENIRPVKEDMPDASWVEITNACFAKDIKLSAHFIQKNVEQTNYSVHGISSAEIEIDVLTGNVQLTRVDILEDVGASMSPLMDVGQIEGAFVMGMGFFLNEKLSFDKETGKLLTNRSWNYTPPGPKDIPIDFRIKFVKNSVNPVFILKSKATGEPPLAMTCVCLFALRNAIQAARRDVGVESWLELAAPATPDQIFLKCLSNRPENYKL